MARKPDASESYESEDMWSWEPWNKPRKNIRLWETLTLEIQVVVDLEYFGKYHPRHRIQGG